MLPFHENYYEYVGSIPVYWNVRYILTAVKPPLNSRSVHERQQHYIIRQSRRKVEETSANTHAGEAKEGAMALIDAIGDPGEEMAANVARSIWRVWLFVSLLWQ